MNTLRLIKEKTSHINGFIPHLRVSVRRVSVGFTLIELLVVIAVIGILASIVLASLNNARIKSRDARRIADLKQLQIALELSYQSQGNQYPAASSACDITVPAANGLEVLKTQGYVPEIPRDPLGTPTTGCYRYATLTISSMRSAYHLGAILEDYTNAALIADKDEPSAASGWDNDFHGLSAAVAPAQCQTTASAGGAQPGGGATGENCYDVKP